jgi:hypothetical protein
MSGDLLIHELGPKATAVRANRGDAAEVIIENGPLRDIFRVPNLFPNTCRNGGRWRVIRSGRWKRLDMQS